MQNVIISKERNGHYFMAFHGYSSWFTADLAKAKTFPSYREAYEYAMRELFTEPSAFQVAELKPTKRAKKAK